MQLSAPSANFAPLGRCCGLEFNTWYAAGSEKKASAANFEEEAHRISQIDPGLAISEARFAVLINTCRRLDSVDQAAQTLIAHCYLPMLEGTGGTSSRPARIGRRTFGNPTTGRSRLRSELGCPEVAADCVLSWAAIFYGLGSCRELLGPRDAMILIPVPLNPHGVTGPGDLMTRRVRACLQSGNYKAAIRLIKG